VLFLFFLCSFTIAGQVTKMEFNVVPCFENDTLPEFVLSAFLHRHLPISGMHYNLLIDFPDSL